MPESSADPLLDSLINDFGANYVFALDLLEPPQKKLPEASRVLDDSEDRLHGSLCATGTDCASPPL